MISVVVPLFNEEATVPELVRRLDATLRSTGHRYEIILVNDGSRDGTREAVRALFACYQSLVLVDLSRNFGHQIAATAGLDRARGDAVVLMDGDLQDPPELIPAMLEQWREGYDVVYAVRRSRRGESRFKIWTAALFYRLTARLTNVSIPVDVGDFRLMSRRVVDVLKGMRERHRFLRGLVSWVGYKQIGIPYDRDVRFAGSTHYPVGKMLKFALDGITAFSEVPLRVATYLGFSIAAFAFVYGVVVLILNALGYNLPGYTSTMLAILLLGGVQLVTIGILGEYVGRIYDEIKERPLYLIASVEQAGASAASAEAATHGDT